jgi:hypothetical protein
MASFGEELKRERELRDISLKEIAEATKISIRFLEALEQNHFDILPGGIFNRGFIRAYARFIGIDGEEMVNAYLHELALRENRKSRDSRAGGAAAGGSPIGLSSGVFRAEPRADARQEAQASSGAGGNAAATDRRSSAALWVLVVLAFVVGALVIILNVLQGGEAGASADSPGQAMRARQRQSRFTGSVPTPAGPSIGGTAQQQQGGATSLPADDRSVKAGEASQAADAADPARRAGDPADAPPLAPQAVSLAPHEEQGVSPSGLASSGPASSSEPSSPSSPAVSEHHVRVIVNEATRVKIECAGQMVLNQELWPGQARAVTCAEPVSLSAVNAGAVEYSLDGAETVPLGKPGEEVQGLTVAPIAQPEPTAPSKGKHAEEGGAPRAGA